MGTGSGGQAQKASALRLLGCNTKPVEHAGVLGVEAVELSVKGPSFKKPLGLVKCDLALAHTSEDHSQWGQQIRHKKNSSMSRPVYFPFWIA